MSELCRQLKALDVNIQTDEKCQFEVTNAKVARQLLTDLSL